MPSRLALDDAIRHKPLNMSSRFSPRVAGENDFLQTVINKVIAAKEVNHKGQGMYIIVQFFIYICSRECGIVLSGLQFSLILIVMMMVMTTVIVLERVHCLSPWHNMCGFSYLSPL